GVAGDVLDLLAEHAVALQRQRLHGVEHAAVAFAVDVLDGELVGAQFVGALVGVRTRLGHVEAEGDGRAVAGVVDEVLGPGIADEEAGRDPGRTERYAALEHAAAGESGVTHGFVFLLSSNRWIVRKRRLGPGGARAIRVRRVKRRC